jgi:hypothetical protein
MVWTQVTPYLALVYNKRFVPDDDSDTLDALPVIIALNALWLTSGALLAALANRDNLITFFSTVSATEYTVTQFRDSLDDEQKFDAVFGNHLHLTKPIISEVKAWIADRWQSWETELPLWFTADAIALIPSSYLPKRALEDLLIEGGGKRIGKVGVAQRDSLMMNRQSGSSGSNSGTASRGHSSEYGGNQHNLHSIPGDSKTEPVY